MQNYLSKFESSDLDKLHQLQQDSLLALRKLAKAVGDCPPQFRESRAIAFIKKVDDLRKIKIQGTEVWSVLRDTAGQGGESIALLYYYFPEIIDRFNNVLKGNSDPALDRNDTMWFMHDANPHALLGDDEAAFQSEIYEGLDKERLKIVYEKAVAIYKNNKVYERLFP